MGFDATVDLNLYRAASSSRLFVNGRFQSPDFLLNPRNKRLSTKSRVHAHDEHEVNLAEHLKSRFDRCTGVEHHANAGSASSNGRDQAMKMLHRFNMNREMVATGIDVILKATFSVFNHQVGVKDGLGAKCLTKSANHGRAKRQIWDEVPVHDIQMHPMQSRIKCFLTILGECCEVGGQNAGGDHHAVHVRATAGGLMSLVVCQPHSHQRKPS